MKILIVDDDLVTRSLLTKTLSKWEYEVLTANDGLEALEIVKKNNIEIVITDWMMPNMDGLALCKEIRSLSNYHYVYIIIITSKDKKNALNEAFENGVDDYITKPIAIERLKTSLSSAYRIVTLSKTLNSEIELNKKTAERLNAILKYSSDVIYTLNLKGNFTSVNNVAKELTGYIEKDLCQINFRDFIPQKNQDEIHNVFKSVYKTGKPLRNYPFEVIIKDGTIKYFETSVGLIWKDNKIVGFQGSARDITQRITSQNALLESEKKYRTLVESMRDGIWMLDDKGYLTYVNESLCRMLGYSKKELTGKHIHILHEEVNEEEANKLISRRNEGISESYEKNYRNKEGHIISVIVSSKPIMNSNSQYCGSIAVVTDVSAIKQAEKEKKDIENQLRQSEKMASIGQLAAGVAHEINNPTAFVSSNLNTLSSYLKDYNHLLSKYRELLDTILEDDQISAYTEQIKNIKKLENDLDMDFIINDVSEMLVDSSEGMERIKKIVMDLKDFAHPGEDKPKYADINKCLDSTLNIVWNEIKYKAQVKKEYGILPEILCYPQQLNQVFANLFVNAAQAIDSEGEIRIKTSSLTENIEIIISDTGTGISKKNIAKIFEPFFTTKDVGKGTGLGLNVAYNIIKKHNGEITVTSEEGSGTSFTIILPANNTDESLRSN